MNYSKHPHTLRLHNFYYYYRKCSKWSGMSKTMKRNTIKEQGDNSIHSITVFFSTKSTSFKSAGGNREESHHG